MASDPVLEQALEGHRGGVNGVDFSDDGLHLASGGDDGVVYLWNFRPGARAFRYTGHTVRWGVIFGEKSSESGGNQNQKRSGRPLGVEFRF